jgi:tight adherence protein C
VTVAQLLAAVAVVLAFTGLRELLGGLTAAGAALRPPSALGPLRRSAAGFLPRLAALAPGRRLAPPRDLAARLAAAGEPAGLGAREWMAIKASCALAVSVPALVAALGGAGRMTLLLALGGPLAGFVAPDFWLSRAIRMRSEASLRDLPDMVDLLRVSVEAGVAPVSAMGAVAAEFDGPLAREWRRLAAAVALGEPQDAALARLAERLPAEEVRAFSQALARARRHGLPLGATLAAQAGRAREAQRRRMRERAARAGPKIQLVVALVLVPSMLLMVAAVLAGELLGGGLVAPL